MNFGTWYLAATAGGEVDAIGTLHPLGTRDLHRRLTAGTGSPGVVVDAGDFDKGLIDFSTFYGILAHVKMVGGHVVVVDEKGPMSHFLGGIGFADPVPVVQSLKSAWQLIGTLQCPVASPVETRGDTQVAVAAPSGAPRQRGLKVGPRRSDTSPRHQRACGASDVVVRRRWRLLLSKP